MNALTISVIIPRPADGTAEQAIQAALASDYAPELLEILEVVGEHPSRQRNMAAKAARGEILYFLDNDSRVPPTLFSRVVRHYHDASQADERTRAGRLAGVGGPNLTPPDDNFLQQTFGYALASRFAHGSMSARYTSTGPVRETGEHELILCNLSVRREMFLREGGFDETLYPNEENEFINRVIAHGGRFLYDPDAVVLRSRRARVVDFLKQFARYGRGRAEQLRVEGLSPRSLRFFLPSGLLLYGLLVVGLCLAGLGAWWHAVPLLVYAALAAGSAILSGLQERRFRLAAVLPLCFSGMHLAYGGGFLLGIFQGRRSKTRAGDPAQPPCDVIRRKTFTMP